MPRFAVIVVTAFAATAFSYPNELNMLDAISP